MFMKRTILVAAMTVALGGSETLRATTITFNSGFANGGAILDGNASGWWDTRAVSGLSGPITDVNVTLNLGGGWNGDLYGYLSYGGQIAVLLNRVGVGSSNPFGYSDAGMQVTLDDQAASDIHLYGAGSIIGGAAWQPDGRNIDPLSAGGSFDSAARSSLLGSFNTLDPNGNWTLFLADVSGGGGVSTLTSWSLDFTTSPTSPSVPDQGPGLPLTGATVLALVATARRMRTGQSSRSPSR